MGKEPERGSGHKVGNSTDVQLRLGLAARGLGGRKGLLSKEMLVIEPGQGGADLRRRELRSYR